jgi:hypothetical protein
LRCELPGVTNWREVLLYGDTLGYEDLPIDGRTRHLLFLTHRRNLFVFVFMYPDEPGAIEQTSYGQAWHGCAVYQIGEWFP